MPPDPPGSTPPTHDWFGNPVESPRRHVPCPRCGAPFSDAPSLAEHLATAHGISTRPAGRRNARSRLTGSNPTHRRALGQAPRSPLRQRLRTVPLWLVLGANLAAAIVVLALVDQHGPGWWAELKPSWQRVAAIPLLWPTAVFLAFRGVD